MADAAIDRGGSVEPKLLARAHLSRARVRHAAGLLDASREDASRAVDLDPTLAAQCEALLGAVERELGNLRAADAHLLRARALLVATPDGPTEAEVLGNLAAVCEWRGQLGEAMQLYQEALAVDRRIGDRGLEGRHLGSVGALLHAERKLDDARRRYEDAGAILESIGDRASIGRCATQLGALCQELGQGDDAMAHYEYALRVHRDLGARREYGITLGYRASLHHELGELSRAREGYQQAVESLGEVGDELSRALFRGALGALLATMDLVEEAARMLDDAESQARALGSGPLLSTIALHRGHLDLARGRAAAAAGRVKEGESLRGRAAERISAMLTSATRLSDDIRFGLRMLELALSSASGRPVSVRPRSGGERQETLVLSEDAGWLRVGAAPEVELRKRLNLRRLLLRLCTHRIEAPGSVVTTSELVEAGWPGERMLAESGVSRVYVAVMALRKLGLRSCLLSRDGGYLIDPAVHVMIRKNM